MSDGEPDGPGTVVDIIAEELNDLVGMAVPFPRISGAAHRAATRLRTAGLLAERPRRWICYAAPEDLRTPVGGPGFTPCPQCRIVEEES